MKEVLVEGHSRRGRPVVEERKVYKEKEVLVEGHSRRGRLLGRWKDRVKEYMYERGASSES